jgi:N-acetylglucosamine-6-sulfatase
VLPLPRFEIRFRASPGAEPHGGYPRRGRAGLIALALAVAITTAGTLSSEAPPTADAASPARPNVIVVETDDQTVESMKVMSEVNARIADKGVTFRDSFVNYSLCCPSRATFLTGEYSHNHGITGNWPPLGGFHRFEYRYAHNNLAVWLHRAGYTTALIGKYLNGYSAEPIVPPGWDYWDGGIGGAVYDYDMNLNGRIVHYGTDAADFKQDVLTQRAVKFIQRGAPPSKPFFLWLTYSAPHSNPPDPNPQPPSDCDGAAKPAPRDADAYASEPLPQPPNFNEADVSDKPSAIRQLPLLDSSQVDEITRKYRCALESLRSVDDGVGRILDTLRRRGELGDTYVIYTSDNGFLNGEHRLSEAKIKPYEESLRVPLVIRGPGIPQGRTAHDLAINADLAPTIVQLAGAKPGLPMDGRSLLPAARNPRIERGRELSIEAFEHSGFRGIRTQRYVYVTFKTNERELYDLRADPYELQNVAADPAYREVRSVLARRLRKLRTCRGDGCRLRPRVSLELRKRPQGRPGRRCAAAPIRAEVSGAQAGSVVEAEFELDGRPVASDTTPPFRRVIAADPGPTTLEVRVSMLDGRRMTIERRLQVCG